MRKVQDDAEIIGIVVQALVSNKSSHNINKILAKHNLTEIDPERWYRINDIIKVLHEIIETEKSYGSTYDMVAIGIAAAELTPLPPGVDTFEDFVDFQKNSVMSVLYRGENVGTIDSVKVGKQEYELFYSLPWPDDLLYGNTYGFARKLLPKGITFTVRYGQKPEADPDMLVLRVKWY